MNSAHGSNGATDPQQSQDRDRGPSIAESEVAAPVAPRLLDDIQVIVDEWRGRLHDQLSLAALEARLAGENLVVILAYGTVVGVLLGGACLLVAAAMVVLLVRLGVPTSLAMLLGALLMVLGAGAFVRAIRRRSRTLQFPASLRSLKPDRKPDEPDQPTDPNTARNQDPDGSNATSPEHTR